MRTLTFDESVKMPEHYQPTKNTTLIHFDTFANRVKQSADNCDFCDHEACGVRDTLIRGQLVIGTNNDEVRRNALKEQWDLKGG